MIPQRPQLRDIPGLHIIEMQAIDDALSGLRGLECTEERDADDESSLIKSKRCA